MAQLDDDAADRAVIRDKGQVTLPQQIRRQLGLRKGDNLIVSVEQGRVVLTPATLVPREQAWYWTDDWHAGEREVDEGLEAGERGSVYRSDEEFLDALRRGVDDPNAL